MSDDAQRHAVSPAQDPPCANCGTPLLGDWCHACGQRRIEPSERHFGHLVAQFVHSLTDLDSRFWRSLRALMLRPGQLSRDYLDGRRARWLSPVSLFLLANLLYFLAPVLTDFSLPFYNQVPGRMAIASMEQPDRLSPESRARIENWPGQLHSPLTAGWVEARVEHRNRQALARSDGAKGYTMLDYARAYDASAGEISKLLIVLHVPFLALALMAVFRQARLFYAEHFVVALHLFAFFVFFIELALGPLGLLAASGRGGTWLQQAWQVWRPLAGLVVLVYVVLALRRSYQAGWVRCLMGALAASLTLAAAHLLVYRSVQFALIFALT
jgi:hypothetical protein